MKSVRKKIGMQICWHRMRFAFKMFKYFLDPVVDADQWLVIKDGGQEIEGSKNCKRDAKCILIWFCCNFIVENDECRQNKNLPTALKTFIERQNKDIQCCEHLTNLCLQDE